MSRPIIFGAQRDFLLPAFQRLATERATVLVRRPEQLDDALLESVKPEWVILPDWSWIVPDQLLALAPFVGFHASDLPRYRGGSPLQHQILDGLVETKLSCFRMAAGVDTGAILLQERLDLGGTIGDVWRRLAQLVAPMCLRLLAGDFAERAQPQGGFVRKRRTPGDSRLPDLSAPLAKLYDAVRALDDPYPNAFVEVDGKRLSFRRPALDGGRLVAEVVIEEAPRG